MKSAAEDSGSWAVPDMFGQSNAMEMLVACSVLALL